MLRLITAYYGLLRLITAYYGLLRLITLFPRSREEARELQFTPIEH
jgi:hypothetical protein